MPPKRRPLSSSQNQGSRKKQAGIGARGTPLRPKAKGGIFGGTTTPRQADSKTSPRTSRSQGEEDAARPRIGHPKGSGRKATIGGLNYGVKEALGKRGTYRGTYTQINRPGATRSIAGDVRKSKPPAKSVEKRQPLQRDLNRTNQQERKGSQTTGNSTHHIPTARFPSSSKKSKSSVDSWSTQNETNTSKNEVKLRKQSISLQLNENPKSSQGDAGSPRQSCDSNRFQIKESLPRKSSGSTIDLTEGNDSMRDIRAPDAAKKALEEMDQDLLPRSQFQGSYPSSLLKSTISKELPQWRERKSPTAGLGLACRLAIAEAAGHGPDFSSFSMDEGHSRRSANLGVGDARKLIRMDDFQSPGGPINYFVSSFGQKGKKGKESGGVSRMSRSENGLGPFARTHPPPGYMGEVDGLIKNMNEKSETASVVSQGNSCARREMERAESVTSFYSIQSKDLELGTAMEAEQSFPFGRDYTGGAHGEPLPIGLKGRRSIAQELPTAARRFQIEEPDSNLVAAVGAMDPLVKTEDSLRMPTCVSSIHTDFDRVPSIEENNRMGHLLPATESLFSRPPPSFPDPTAIWSESILPVVDSPLGIVDGGQQTSPWAVPGEPASTLGSPCKSNLGGFSEEPLAFDWLPPADPEVEEAVVSQMDFPSPVERSDRVDGAVESEDLERKQAVGGGLPDLSCWDVDVRTQTPSALQDTIMKEVDRYAAVNAVEQKVLDLDTRVQVEASLRQKAALDVLDTQEKTKSNELSLPKAREEQINTVAANSHYIPSFAESSTMTETLSQEAWIQTVNIEPEKPVMRDASTATDLESETSEDGRSATQAEAFGGALVEPTISKSSSENKDAGPSKQEDKDLKKEMESLRAEVDEMRKWIVAHTSLKEALTQAKKDQITPSESEKSLEVDTAAATGTKSWTAQHPSVDKATCCDEDLREVESIGNSRHAKESSDSIIDVDREEADKKVVPTKARKQESKLISASIYAMDFPVVVGPSAVSGEKGTQQLSTVKSEGGSLLEVVDSLHSTEDGIPAGQSSGKSDKSTPQAVSSEEFDISEESISENLEISSPPVEAEKLGEELEGRVDVFDASLTEDLSVPESIIEENDSIVESIPESSQLRESEGQLSLCVGESIRSSAATSPSSSSSSSDSNGPSWLTSSQHLESLDTPSDEAEPPVVALLDTEEKGNPVETDLPIEQAQWLDEDVEASVRKNREERFSSRESSSTGEMNGDDRCTAAFDEKSESHVNSQTSSSGHSVAHLAENDSRQESSVSDLVPSLDVLHESQSLQNSESIGKFVESHVQDPDQPTDKVESGSDGSSSKCESIQEESLSSGAQSSSDDVEALYQIGSTNEDLERIADEVEQDSQGSGDGKQGFPLNGNQIEAHCAEDLSRSREEASSSDKDSVELSLDGSLDFECAEGTDQQESDVPAVNQSEVEQKPSHLEVSSLDKDEIEAPNDSLRIDASVDEEKSLSSVSECYSDQFASQSSDDKPYEFAEAPSEETDALPTPKPQPSIDLRDHPEPPIGRLPPILPSVGQSIPLPPVINIPITATEAKKVESETDKAIDLDRETEEEGDKIQEEVDGEVKGGSSSSTSSSISEEQMECEASEESDLNLDDYTERVLDLQKSLAGSQDDSPKDLTKEEARVGSSGSEEFDLSNPDDLDDVEIEFEGEGARHSSEGSDDSVEKGGAIRLAPGNPMDVESGLGLDASLDVHDDKDLEINWQEDYVIPEQAAPSSKDSVEKEGESEPVEATIEKRVDSFDEVERVEVRSDEAYVSNLIAQWMDSFDLTACAEDDLHGMDFADGPVPAERFSEVEKTLPNERNEQKEYNRAIFDMMNEALLEIHVMHKRPRVRQLTHELHPSSSQLLTEVQRRVVRWINSQGALEDLLQESLWEWDH